MRRGHRAALAHLHREVTSLGLRRSIRSARVDSDSTRTHHALYMVSNRSGRKAAGSEVDFPAIASTSLRHPDVSSFHLDHPRSYREDVDSGTHPVVPFGSAPCDSDSFADPLDIAQFDGAGEGE